VLQHRADDAGGELGAQRERPSAAVGEREHLLADHVGRLAYPAHEELGVLEGGQFG
jgi:hypothetical protein